jgi:adenosine deaminase
VLHPDRSSLRLRGPRASKSAYFPDESDETMFIRRGFAALLLVAGCSSAGGASDPPAVAPPDPGPAPVDDAGPGPDGGPKPCNGTPAECAATWEKAASDRYDAILGKPVELAAFLKAVPKGGDLHNHLTGAVYAETYLDWAKADGDCINSTTFAVVYPSQCSASTQPVPTSGAFYDQIVRAWSMKDFVPGAQTGRDHFFATFGKFGAVAGAHRDDDLADVLVRAADENQVYVETMFNLGKNIGTLAAKVWTTPVTAADLPTIYDLVKADPTFDAQLALDVKAVNDAAAAYKSKLGCNGATPPAACKVGMRFVSQVARTGALDNLFGQLISAYEAAAQTPDLVAANLSSPEDDTTSLRNYDLHMEMLDFLNTKYTVPGTSPLHITLHAGELTPQYLPPGFETANTFHVRAAVEKGHAERIGHGIDILSETDSSALMDDMAKKGVMVEVCLSSNDQILEVKGTKHPLSEYLKHKVPIALATDDQGVSRSSMAGEYMRAALDQKLKYGQLKTMARNSLEHAFLPGASLWTSVADAKPVAACASTATMGVGDPANAECAKVLKASEKATIQWELERRFRDFESRQ